MTLDGWVGGWMDGWVVELLRTAFRNQKHTDKPHVGNKYMNDKMIK